MKEIPDKSIDMVLCDLPYGTTAARWDSVIPFESLWGHYKRILKEAGVIALFSTQPFTTSLISSNMKDYKYSWYWVKNNVTGFAFAKYQPMRKVEDINIFYKKAGSYNPQGLKKRDKIIERKAISRSDVSIYPSGLGKSYKSEFYNYPINILKFDMDKDRFHPTQKPVPLLEYLVKTYTNEGETVLDNCMGSGSTGVACMNTNRRFIGIEKEEQFYNIAKERIDNARKTINTRRDVLEY